MVIFVIWSTRIDLVNQNTDKQNNHLGITVSIMNTPFGKTKKLECDIQDYLKLLKESGIIFHEAIHEYMNFEFEDFDKRVIDISELEKEADELRRVVRTKLYKDMLIPEARGDVWDLVESLDGILNGVEKVLENFSFERPHIPQFVKRYFIKIGEHTQKTIEELVNATNAYFTNPNMVNDYINKVLFYEHEIDKIEDLIKQTVFSTDKIEQLSHRIQLRYFAEKMALLSDISEKVCEKLAVFVIKQEA